MNQKLVSLAEAASLVEPGQMLALGGMTLYRRPIAFVRALLQRFMQTGQPGKLTLFAFTAGLESDILVGAGLVQSVRTCYFGLEIFGLAPMFTFRAGRGEINIIEETEVSLSAGLRAQMGGIGFLPARGWIGTDLPRLRPDVLTVRDPYSGEELMAFPAIQPDVAVIHALQADYDGNVTIGSNRGVDEELALASRTVIVTAEEIVPALTHAEITAPFIDVVVHVPHGAYPTSCHPLYPLDGEALLEYTDQASNPEAFQAYLKKFILS